MATHAPFIPVQPPRTADWVSSWRGLFGERLRNTVYGWSEPAFDEFYRKRRILGFTVHIVTDPDMVERVLLGNKENYLRPRIAQRILSPLIGNGLLSAEGEDWKKQRRIVAPTFAPGAVAKMSAIIASVAARQTGDWLRGTIRTDMARAATDATMHIIADTLFSSDARLTTRAAGEHIDNLVLASGQARISTILGLQDFDVSPVMARARRGRVLPTSGATCHQSLLLKTLFRIPRHGHGPGFLGPGDSCREGRGVKLLRSWTAVAWPWREPQDHQTTSQAGCKVQLIESLE